MPDPCRWRGSGSSNKKTKHINVLTAAKSGRLHLFAHLIVLMLSGLLIFYHTYTLLDLYVGADNSTHTWFEYLQSALRAAITISLLCVAAGIRGGIWAMWLSIAGLVGTQLGAHLGNLPVDFTAGRHPLSYLRGFIFPTVISLAILISERTTANEQR